MRLLIAFVFLFLAFPASAALTNADKQEISFKNLLGPYNAGFENGLASWTPSNTAHIGVTNTGSNLLVGKGSATWDAAASGDTLLSKSVATPNGLIGLNCEASVLLLVPSGTATHSLQAYDATNAVVLASTTVVTSTVPQINSVYFPCPNTTGGNATNIRIRLYANANEPLMVVDEGYIGVARNIGTAAQSYLKGTLKMTGCTDWSRSNTSFGSFTATSGCSYTATGDVLSPATVIPGFRIQNAGPGRYLIIARGAFNKTVSTTNADAFLRFSDGTNTWGEQLVSGAGSAGGQYTSNGVVVGGFTYSTGQGTLSIDLQGKVTTTTSSTAIAISDDGGSNATSAFTEGLVFEVYFFPTTSQTVVNINQQMGPTVQKFTSGSGTYTKPAGVTMLRVRMAGGGAGGFGSGTVTGTAPTDGADTTFGTSLLTAGKGLKGSFGSSGGAGGACTITAPAIGSGWSGGGGQGSAWINPGTGNGATMGGMGGGNMFSGGGAGGTYGGAGQAGATNSGAGGGGGGGNSGVNGVYAGSGGGAGCVIDAWLVGNGLANTFAYSVGAAGNAGAAGTSGYAGGAGTAGYIEVTEYYGNTTALIAGGVTARDNPNAVSTINTIVSKTTTYTATDQEETILLSASGGAWTLSLPAAASYKGKKYHLVINAASANAVTVDPNASETVCGQTTVKLVGNGDELDIQSDGTNWLGLSGTCERKERARISSAAAITRQSTNWISTAGVTDTSLYTLTYVSGIFSAAPDCGCMAGDPQYCAINTITTTIAEYRVRKPSTEAKTADTASIVCVGPR